MELQYNDNKILIIQTAFIGDVVLATSFVEEVRIAFPESEIHFLLRKGNESLLANNPNIAKVLIWDKKKSKYRGLFQLLTQVRKESYQFVFNLQRFGSTGLLTALSKAIHTVGFSKNPFSYFFTHKIEHTIGFGKHEVERNASLLDPFRPISARVSKPKIYPSQADEDFVQTFKGTKYCCMAPTSVWFTKQFPFDKWLELINEVKEDTKIYLLGGPSDSSFCAELINRSKRGNIENLCGKLSFFQSAVLMRDATMNYVNDSAPMHLCSAVDAPTTAIYCSTIPNFGFGPLSKLSKVVETKETLSCRPCGLHGYKSCPKKHFDCGYSIKVEQIINHE